MTSPSAMLKGLRVALTHDLLVSYGGSEQVLFEFHKMFPDAPVYTTMFDPGRLPARFAELQVKTSFLQHVPLLAAHPEAMIPLMPMAFESFNLEGFDLILSSTHAFSKGVRTPPGALHVCYCYTPLRYAWSHETEYLAHIPLAPISRPIARFGLKRLRRSDLRTAQRVDVYITQSRYVQKRIEEFYGRQSEVVYPPINLERFRPGSPTDQGSDFFLVAGRLQPYKRTEMAIEACTTLGLQLKVIGRGPELKRLRRMAGPTVEFLGEVDDATLERAYRDCRALIFTSDEDLGLTPLEAMASGRPVIALNKGGARETVLPGITGELYDDSGVGALIAALKRFHPDHYDPAACRSRAEEFSVDRFRNGIESILERELSRRAPN